MSSQAASSATTSDPQQANPDSHKHPLRRLLGYARDLSGRVILASLYSVLNKLFDIMPEILIGMAIDVVVRQEDSFLARFGIEDPKQQLLLLGGLTFLIWLGESVFQYLYSIEWRNLAQTLQHRLRLDAWKHLQRRDMAFFESQSSGNLTAILNDDINQLERFLNGGANDLIQVLTAVIGVGSVFFYVSPKLAVLAFAPIPLIIIGAFWFQKKAQPRYARVRELAGSLAKTISNNIAGIATIKSFTREKHELDKLQQVSSAYSRANAEAIAVSSAFIPIIRMAILAGFLATFIIGGLDVLAGRLNVGAYGVLVFLTQRLLWPFTNLAVTMDLYERAMASARRVLNLIEGAPESRHEDHCIEKKLRGDVIFEGINFHYGHASEKPVLRDINLHIPAGKTLALVGQTGSGKSTLVKLLLRFYRPQSGRILIDGTDISRLCLHSLREQIGLVSQDIYLFDGTVRDNIAYGKPGASEEEIQQAAKLAEAEEFIQALPAGYDTVVGERGIRLSGGQRQRISIARAILKNPPILILDEATSAVDNETEAAIQRSMLKIARNRTVIVIAHRLSTVVNADRIVVLDHGRISESGDHHQLVNSAGGLYAKLWAVQTGHVGGISQEAKQDSEK